MKRYYLFSLLLFVAFLAKGQRYTDFGIFAGGASYMGDLNSTNYFFSPSSAFGAFYRININQRYAVRVSGNYLTLSGNPSSYPDQAIVNFLPSFPSTILDFNAQMEFNFMPYITGEEKLMNSVYVAGGLGYSFMLGGSEFGAITLPFGLGFKLNLSKRLSAGLEWSFRKTFSDGLDNVQPSISNSLFNNNDWYSIYGLFISYKFVKFAADCPVYK